MIVETSFRRADSSLLESFVFETIKFELIFLDVNCSIIDIAIQTRSLPPQRCAIKTTDELT